MLDNQIAVNDKPVYSQFKGDDDFTDLIQFYVDSAGSKKSEIQFLFEIEDYQQLTVIAHQINGSAGGYGFSDLGEIAVRLEQAARLSEKEIVSPIIQEISNYLDAISV